MGPHRSRSATTMAHRISHSRWYLKKAARKGLATTAWASGWLTADRCLRTRPRVRVLTYHRFGDAPMDPFCVGRDAFDRQMRWLAEQGSAVSLAELEVFLCGGKFLPDDAVLVTVDDGFRSVLTEMLPVLREYRIPAVAYVSPGLIRESSASGTESDEYLSWDGLESLASGGMTIGSHGWSHRSLGQMSPAEVRDEAARSRDELQSRLGHPITSLAYPYGTRADFNQTTVDVLAETGYTTAFTSQHGAIAHRADSLQLPRVKVEGGEGTWMFRLLCRGAMDGWRMVDHTLWQLQGAR